MFDFDKLSWSDVEHLPCKYPRALHAALGADWGAVVDAHWTTLVSASEHYPGSATQLGAWLQCQRNWGIDKIDHTDRGAVTFLDEGIEFHKHAEVWMLGGVVPPAADRGPAEWATRLIGYVPEPGQARVEGAFRWRRARSGVWYAGVIDWETSPGVWAPALGLACLGDHKSCKSIKDYALTQDDLATDAQAMIYAGRYFDANPDATNVALQWTYVEKATKRKPEPVRAIVDRAHVDTQMDQLDREVLAMIAARVLVRSSVELAERAESCGGHGFGCFRAANCLTHQRAALTPAALLLRKGAAA